MSVIVLARIAVETASPLAIYSGDRDLLSNNALARDWNGNPYLPATAIAGVWRSIVENFAKESGAETVKNALIWFGTESSSDNKGGGASRVIVSDGLLLDSHSRLPGDGVGADFRVLCDRTDEIYSKLSLSGDRKFERPGCRINARKTNHEGALFKSKTLPKGVRFAFDVKFELEGVDETEGCTNLLDYISSDYFTMGSKTANGFGAFRVVGQKVEILDLEQFADDPRKLSQKIRDFVSSRDVVIADEIKHKEISGDKRWEFTLACSGSMRIGTGKSLEITEVTGANGKKIGLMSCEQGIDSKNRNIQQCFTDTRFEWNGKNFSREVTEFIIPGSTIKGILAHRTMYHFLRRRNWFADRNICDESGLRPQMLIEKLLKNETPPEEFEPYYRLFGRNDPKEHGNMLSGSLKVSDAVVDSAGIVNRMHNKIDRFTGAVMPSELFGQARLVDPSFKISIRIDPSRRNELPDDCEIMKAFEDSIYDMKNGYLNICAGSGRDTAVFKQL